ncbi:class I SAM-dependent methyltransferase [Zunongwangia profunda]|uniref:class I SAM-dependent methyltransferase n=1 Tax=Zunongwangia profunda TaxID=398743 RepID=UPI000C966489|nr:class I SAM-dependent methyltransferase [Zunongwangia profunda]MAG88930.1 SAM-dependent methyltransferase [Flavobacteriaceae bacterium]MCC4227740.1 class I SAM-dependent methyltransferase [Zunongwangia profunda]|tara:strand:+ start:5763 stop:6383 length:621 start_codon:yes stop_codon:yes gene_type:complete
MIDFWNKRYIEEAFSYGIFPNVFFKQELDKLMPKSVLLPAEGEGRNAVYALRKGWDVTAFDFSSQAKKKAVRLAKSQRVRINYDVASVLDFNTDKKFDVLGLCYAHFPASIRARANQHLLQFLKPNGLVIFEAFSKAQSDKSSGGPKSEEMLYSIEEVKEEFKGLAFDVLEETEIVLKEGIYHQGEASVIRFLGSKKLWTKKAYIK